MVNPFKEVNWKPDNAEKRTFGKSLIIGFPIIAVIFLLVLRAKNGEWQTDFPIKLAACGAGAGVLFILIPQIATPVYVVWYCLACCIGLVIGNVLLGIVFYVLVGGLGLFMRLIGRDTMGRRFDRSASTYWRDAKQPTDPKRYFSQF
ncbi:MAG: hypothetical protein CMO80_09390 [Verrucomicrobiales bacterium]|nr:hypothetical protein [Verrucomicrobiales bacterium]|tara:strand:- start:591 stop:1031 length:441 start_codon:yes stop_codon:yes gene_type:complete